MEIAKCRWCKQDCFLSQDDTGMYYVRSHCPHTVSGPSCATKEEAINMWNEMMYTGIPATLEATNTDYRDRVDRMAAAIVCGQWANHAVSMMDANEVAQDAIAHIDAIDAAIAKREKEKMLEDAELVLRQKIQEAIDNPPYVSVNCQGNNNA